MRRLYLVPPPRLPGHPQGDEVDEKTSAKSPDRSLLCTGCEVCAQVCPRDAITFRGSKSV